MTKELHTHTKECRDATTERVVRGLEWSGFSDFTPDDVAYLVRARFYDGDPLAFPNGVCLCGHAAPQD